MLNRNEFMAAVARKGITHGELARRVGMTKNTLSAKINGKSYFDTKQIEDICKELDIYDDGEKIKIFLYQPSHNRDIWGFKNKCREGGEEWKNQQ